MDAVNIVVPRKYNAFSTTKSKSVSIVYYIIWIVYFIYAQNLDFRTSSPIILYGIPILLFGSFLFYNKLKLKPRFPFFFKWFSVFCFILLIGIFYSPDFVTSIDTMKVMAILLIAFYVFSNICSTLSGRNALIICYIIATFINSVYIYIVTDFASFSGDIRIGLGLNLWNANSIGLLGATAFWLSFYLIRFYKQTQLKKVFLFLCLLNFAILSFLSGSRTALVFFIGVPLVYWIFTGGQNFILRIIGASFIVLFIYFLCINIPFFYKVIGNRLEGAVSLYLGGENVEGSAAFRLQFIQNGIEWFKQRMVFGYGTTAYAFLNNKYNFIFTYSHNNFIELLVNHGIVGFAVYYSLYIVLIVNLFKNRHIDECCFMLALVLIQLFSHYGSVSYHSYDELLVLTIACSFLAKNKKYSKICLVHSKI